jgi:HemY protein
VWTADGVVSDRWLPVSPRGRLDGYEWRVPLAEIGMTHPVVDAPPPPLPEIKPVAERPAPIEIKALAPSETPKPVSPPKPAAKPAPKPVAAEPVVPLIQVPDDPGPDAGLDPDPLAEKPLPGDGWPRGGKLFR